ncbi:hypothetical protein BKA65DRAFT_543916 [Rhexocercosporidium sp. MPI-PUGE-AT-0058]|nr:hypothetical protein BKA65DRAFT_543916 [Rhexocercosporidium sp. MPI-PUGE-AT-0058]
MQADSHQHDSTNHMDFQPDLSLPFSPKQGLRVVLRFATKWGSGNPTGVTTHPTVLAPGSYGSHSIVASGGGLRGLGPLLPDAFAPVFYNINAADAWELHGLASLHQNVTLPTGAPWDSLPQSRDLKVSPLLVENDFVYPPPDLGSALTNHHLGFMNTQPGKATLGFGTMDAPNLMAFNSGMPLAPFAMPDTVANPLPSFDNDTIHTTPSLSFNTLPVGSTGSPATPGSPSSTLQGRLIRCNFPLCNKSFKRAADRKRHEDSVHLNVPGIYLCHIPGCPKSHGKGYKRADKVTEHLWRKHANLGYTKA